MATNPNVVMAGLDPATQCAHVGARERLSLIIAASIRFTAAQTRGHWAAGSSPAMTDSFVHITNVRSLP